MEIIKVKQQSPEWYEAKCGVPSASNFDKIITTKGTPSKQRTKYLYRLAGEAVSGKSEDTYQSEAMARGCELEDEARQLYQIINDVTVDQVGFCKRDGYGASPDGLIGKDGLIEIKCPNMATHVGYLIENKLPTEYFQQTQGQLLVTKRKWLDFVSYYPGIKPFIIRTHSDKQFIEALDRELKIFCAELQNIIRSIR